MFCLLLCCRTSIWQFLFIDDVLIYLFPLSNPSDLNDDNDVQLVASLVQTITWQKTWHLGAGYLMLHVAPWTHLPGGNCVTSARPYCFFAFTLAKIILWYILTRTVLNFGDSVCKNLPKTPSSSTTSSRDLSTWPRVIFFQGTNCEHWKWHTNSWRYFTDINFDD